jgi:hypothetical protein
MHDLISVLQELYRHEVNCKIQSFWDCGFRMVLGDDLNGELASFDVRSDELPAEGERLWELARKHYHGLPGALVEPAFWPAERVVPFSRVIARAVPDNLFPVDVVQDPVMEAEVLAYPVVSSNDQSATVWYLNTRGEVRQEALGLRDGWRQSDRFRYGAEKTADEFRHLYLQPAEART